MKPFPHSLQKRTLILDTVGGRGGQLPEDGVVGSFGQQEASHWCWQRKTRALERSEGELFQSSKLKAFNFNELKTATRNIRPDSVLGEGGFSALFKGWIDEHSLTCTRPGTGMVFAVKRLNQEGVHKEWLTEIKYLGQMHHPNLAKMIDYCLEDEHRLLVYEFMPHGSMENHLFRRSAHFQPLSWSLRMKVVLSAANGLAFLHSDEAKVIAEISNIKYLT